MKCPRCHGVMAVVEYDSRHKYFYEGGSEYHCHQCQIRMGRFCGKELGKDEVETCYCDGTGHSRIVDL